MTPKCKRSQVFSDLKGVSASIPRGPYSSRNPLSWRNRFLSGRTDYPAGTWTSRSGLRKCWTKEMLRNNVCWKPLIFGYSFPAFSSPSSQLCLRAPFQIPAVF